MLAKRAIIYERITASWVNSIDQWLIVRSIQVVPNYLLLFEVDPTEPELFAVPLCDNCQDFPAAIWCPADTAKYGIYPCDSKNRGWTSWKDAPRSLSVVLRDHLQTVRELR